MPADGCIARIANVGVSEVCLLNHRASETRELCNIAAQHGLAKVEVAEEALERIIESLVGSGSEQRFGRLRPMIGGCDGERFLTRKVMKERTLGHAGPGAEFVNGRCGVALLTDDRDGCVDEIAARTAPRQPLKRMRIHMSTVPTSRYGVKIGQWAASAAAEIVNT